MNLKDVLIAEEQESNKTITEASEDNVYYLKTYGVFPIGLLMFIH